MRRALVAAAVLVLAGGAFLAGRASRSAPPEPNRTAERVAVEGIEAARWRLADAEVPPLVTPEPTPAPTEAPPAVPTSVPDETSTDTGTTAVPPAPTTVTAPPPSDTGGGTNTGGGGGQITGDTE